MDSAIVSQNQLMLLRFEASPAPGNDNCTNYLSPRPSISAYYINGIIKGRCLFWACAPYRFIIRSRSLASYRSVFGCNSKELSFFFYSHKLQQSKRTTCQCIQATDENPHPSKFGEQLMPSVSTWTAPSYKTKRSTSWPNTVMSAHKWLIGESLSLVFIA